MLSGDIDENLCITVEQMIYWNGEIYKCTRDDVMTQNKIQVLKSTLSNVKSYIENTIKVMPLKKQFETRVFSNLITIKPQNSTADLFVTVVAKPTSSTISVQSAIGVIGVTDTTDGRPIQGLLVIIPSQIPSEAQNYNSIQRTFFQSILHQMIHIMGVSTSVLRTWVDPTSKSEEIYHNFPMSELSMDKYKGKIFRILNTPYAHQYASKRFGKITFATEVLSGIELEIGNDLYSYGSHPSARVYFDDFFVGQTVNPSRFSSIYCVLLNDTGWYITDDKFTQDLAWGLGESMEMPTLGNFPIDAPETSFPSHYLCNPSDLEKDVCTHDYAGIAYCRGQKVNCITPSSDDDQQFCNIKSFTDPYNYGYRGVSKTHDFMLYKAPYANSRCNDISKNGNDILTGELYGGESLCFMSKLTKTNYIYGDYRPACYRVMCTNNNTVIIYVEGQSKECEYEGQVHNFTGFGGDLICPDPKNLCGIRKVYGFLGPTPTPTAVPEKEFPIVTVICATLASAFLLIMIVVVIVHFRKNVHRKKQVENDEKEIVNKDSDPNDIFNKI